jgi:hypothetical protein
MNCVVCVSKKKKIHLFHCRRMAEKRVREISDSSDTEEPTTKRARYVPVQDKCPWMDTPEAHHFLEENDLFEDAAETNERLKAHLQHVDTIVHKLTAEMELVKQHARRYFAFINNSGGCMNDIEAGCKVCKAMWFQEEDDDEDIKLFGRHPRICTKCRRIHCRGCPCVRLKLRQTVAVAVVEP